MKNVVVIKCGGSTIDALSDSFFQSVKALQDAGFSPVVVHGGGPAIKRMLGLLKVDSEFVNGLRKTNEEVMEVVEMVLSGSVNKNLVRNLEKAGVFAVGLSGSDNHLIQATPIDEPTLGLVGEVSDVNTDLLMNLLERGLVPVIAPVGVSRTGRCYNINADTAAGAVALALNAKKLLFVTDVPGILKDGELLKNVTEEEVRGLISDQTIYGGMIPKVEAAMKSLQGNLEEVVITAADSGVIRDGKIAGTIIQKARKVTTG